MIIMYYEYMTTQYFVRFFLSIGHFLFWNNVSFVPVRVLHKDEKILGCKHIYLPHVQTAIYDSKVKIFLKQGIYPVNLVVAERSCSIWMREFSNWRDH
jgi:hypothetical protein